MTRAQRDGGPDAEEEAGDHGSHDDLDGREVPENAPCIGDDERDGGDRHEQGGERGPARPNVEGAPHRRPLAGVRSLAAAAAAAVARGVDHRRDLIVHAAQLSAQLLQTTTRQRLARVRQAPLQVVENGLQRLPHRLPEPALHVVGRLGGHVSRTVELASSRVERTEQQAPPIELRERVDEHRHPECARDQPRDDAEHVLGVDAGDATRDRAPDNTANDRRDAPDGTRDGQRQHSVPATAERRAEGDDDADHEVLHGRREERPPPLREGRDGLAQEDEQSRRRVEAHPDEPVRGPGTAESVANREASHAFPFAERECRPTRFDVPDERSGREGGGL